MFFDQLSLLPFPCLFLLFVVCTQGAENPLRINTDLLAGVIEGGAGGTSTATTGTANDKLRPLHVPNPTGTNGATQSTSSAGIRDGGSSAIALAAANICTREETYVEQVRFPSMQPVRIRTATWCLEMPPRCSNYRTEIREVIKLENITKTRTIRFCCAGYEGNISANFNDTICKPVCRGGCGRGRCETPDVCSCEAGYTGTHCTQRCDHDHWGLQCRHECQCRNGAACDNKSGICHCTSGWTGEFCELPCPVGTYGVMCRKACECAAHTSANVGCHPQSGVCAALITPNATHAMIANLNSTIANITHNLDRIAKKIGNIATTTALPNAVLSSLAAGLATGQSLPEVILVKPTAQAEHAAPKIIVHGTGAAGLLENLHSAATAAAAGGKGVEVIHVITGGWPAGGAAASASTPMNFTHKGDDVDLVSFAAAAAATNNAASSTNAPRQSASGNGYVGNGHAATAHETNLLALLLVVLLLVLIVITVSFLFVYRRYQAQRQRAGVVLAARNSDGAGAVPLGGIVPADLMLNGNHGEALSVSAMGGKATPLKPLPDLPAFTQMVRSKLEEPELYDTASNRSSLVKTPSYTYARKESLYSVVLPKSRKGSQESHLYDEIRYPSPTLLESPVPLQYTHLPAAKPTPQPNNAAVLKPPFQHPDMPFSVFLSPRPATTAMAASSLRGQAIYVQAPQANTPQPVAQHVGPLSVTSSAPPVQNAKYLQVPQPQRPPSLGRNRVAHL